MGEFIKLGSLVDIRTGKLNANAANENGCYPFFTCSVEPLTINTYAYDCESVLIAGNWDLNVKYYNGKFNAYQRTYIIESKDKDILSVRFLYYFLCEYIDTLRNNSIGGVIKYIKLSDLTDINFPLIPIQDQKRIVKILDKAQEIRTKKKLANEKLDEFLKSTFIDMFGDPVINSKQLPKVKLSDMGTLVRGKSKHRPRNAPELLNGPYPLIQTGDVANSGLYLKTYNQTYSEMGLKQSKMWKAGTLCITIAANIAKTSILTFDACFPDSIVGFTNSDKCSIHYIQFWLMFLQAVLEAEAPQSAQKNINLEILNSLELPYPPIEQQNQFAQIVQKVEAQKENNQKVIEQMDNLFNSLMQQAFNSGL